MKDLIITLSFISQRSISYSSKQEGQTLTFASSKKLKRKVKQLYKEKLVGTCLRKAKFGSSSQHVGQQYIELP